MAIAVACLSECTAKLGNSVGTQRQWLLLGVQTIMRSCMRLPCRIAYLRQMHSSPIIRRSCEFTCMQQSHAVAHRLPQRSGRVEGMWGISETATSGRFEMAATWRALQVRISLSIIHWLFWEEATHRSTPRSNMRERERKTPKQQLINAPCEARIAYSIPKDVEYSRSYQPKVCSRVLYAHHRKNKDVVPA